MVEDDFPVKVFKSWHGSSESVFSRKSVGFADGVHEDVDIGFVVVNRERSPRRGANPEAAHQRFGAMVAGPHADAGLVEHLGEVVGVDVFVGEADDAGPRRGGGRAVDDDVVTVALLQRRHGVGGERLLRGPGRLHAQATEVVDGGAEPDGLGDGWSAGLELPGDVVGGEPVEAHVADHLAPGQERRHRFEQLASRPQGADAGRPEHLVPGEGDEVGPHGPVRRLAGGGRTGRRPRAPARRRRGRRRPAVAHRGQGAEHVGSGGDGQQLGAVEELVQVVQIEGAVGAEAQEPELVALFLSQLQPGDEIGMVLDLARHHGVARPRLFRPQQ